MHRYGQVKHQCHSASIIVAEMSMITLVVILGVTVPSIPQNCEKFRREVDVPIVSQVFATSQDLDGPKHRKHNAGLIHVIDVLM